MKGVVTVTIKNPKPELIEELKSCGIKVRYSKMADTYWAWITNEEQLIEIYVLDRGLNEAYLRKIVEEIKSYKELHIV